MFYITKTITFSAAHYLVLKKWSKCRQLHGHNWKITVIIGSASLNDEGMVVDFGYIKDVCMEFDHGHLNDRIKQPTAENLAIYFDHKLSIMLQEENKEAFVAEIIVEETDGNVCRLIRRE